MKTLQIFEKGDIVMVKGVVDQVQVEPNGVHKYQVRDIKSNNRIETWFTGEEIIPCPEEPKKKEATKK